MVMQVNAQTIRDIIYDHLSDGMSKADLINELVHANMVVETPTGDGINFKYTPVDQALAVDLVEQIERGRRKAIRHSGYELIGWGIASQDGSFSGSPAAPAKVFTPCR